MASFNPINVQAATMPQNQPLTLKTGQLFHGTIKQLFPNQMAEVHVGGHKLFAKLEVPLKVGDSHFFQVTNTEAQAEIKVVSAPLTQAMTPAEQMAKLLDTMNLPKTAEMKQVMAHFMKEQIPMAKEQLLQAENWLRNLPTGVTKQNALLAMQHMLANKMPFTNDVFQAIVQGTKTDGMHSALQQLEVLLRNQAGGDTTLKTAVLQQMQAVIRPLDGEAVGVVVARAVQTLQDSKASMPNQLQALAVLKEVGVLPKSATLQSWQTPTSGTSNQQRVGATLTQPAHAGQLIQQVLNAQPNQGMQLAQHVKTWAANEQLLSESQKVQLTQLVERFASLPKNETSLQAFAKQVHQQLLQAYAQNTERLLFTQNAQGLSTKDQLLSLLRPEVPLQVQEQTIRQFMQVVPQSSQQALQAAVTQAQMVVESNIDGKAMEQAMKTVLKGLGVSYEAVLASRAGNIQEVAQQLKPQLLALMQDIQTPVQIKDAAETVMARMNGMQLLSAENGHQHQLIMQVPLEFFGKKMDATLQWNGRMQKNGKIDANYARILFYLNMTSIQETVIDMQVQNRVVTMTVFNDDPLLQKLAEPLQQSLKTSLLEKNYQLSGVFIRSFDKKVSTQEIKQQDLNGQGGVDLRI